MHVYVCDMYVCVFLDSKALEIKVHLCEVPLCTCLVSSIVLCT